MRGSAVQRLLEGLRKQAHDFRPSLQVFPDLDVDKVAADLRLNDRGQERGGQEQPPAPTATLDEVELAIVERVESEKRAGHAILIDHLQTFADRTAALDLEGRFATITQAAPEAVADFRVTSRQGRDDLFTLRRQVVEIEREREDFRTENKLRRAARLSAPGMAVFKGGILAVLFVIETILNGSFLAKGNELGYVGGVAQAASFALLNIVVSFLLGLVGVRQLNHRSSLRKAIGLASLLIWFCFALSLNLALAHYREASGALSLEVGREVIQRIRSAPLSFSEIESWLLFSLGFVFSVVATTDGLFFVDPYPGYGALEKRCIAAHGAYTQRKSELIEELREIRDDASEAMTEAARDLGLRRSEFEAIVQSRARIVALFGDHQKHLQRAARALLSSYREANRRARATKAPAHFDQSFDLEMLAPEINVSDDLTGQRVRMSVESALKVLDDQVKAISSEYEAAVSSYRQLDDMIVNEKDGQPALQAA